VPHATKPAAKLHHRPHGVRPAWIVFSELAIIVLTEIE
jgi:hypothetical protein